MPRFADSSPQIQHGLQADVQPRTIRDATNSEEDTGHEGCSIGAVMRDREGLADIAQEHALVRDEPTQAD